MQRDAERLGTATGAAAAAHCGPAREGAVVAGRRLEQAFKALCDVAHRLLDAQTPQRTVWCGWGMGCWMRHQDHICHCQQTGSPRILVWFSAHICCFIPPSFCGSYNSSPPLSQPQFCMCVQLFLRVYTSCLLPQTTAAASPAGSLPAQQAFACLNSSRALAGYHTEVLDAVEAGLRRLSDELAGQVPLSRVNCAPLVVDTATGANPSLAIAGADCGG